MIAPGADGRARGAVRWLRGGTMPATLHGGRVRCRIEKTFGRAKRSYGLARARYLGRRRVSLQVRLTFLAYNLKRAVALLRLQSA